jgi:hypothetical protein
MKTLNFLYTDGRDVVVTDSELEAKGSTYSLKGITDFGLAIIKPNILPGILILLLGVFIVADAYFFWIPDASMEKVSLPTVSEGRAEIELIAGIIIMVIGCCYFLFARKRYALSIETAEGIKNVVVSKKREYINQVIDALQKAKENWRNTAYDKAIN